MTGQDDLDPTIRRFQQQVAAAYGRYPDFAGLPIAERRRIAEEVRAPWAAGGPEMARTEQFRVGQRGVRIRIHRPERAGISPALVYLHGGGWAMFSLDTHDRLMREYAARAGIIVVGVDYSLSPEAKFPTALDEILSVIEWLRDEGPAHGIDPARLAIGGDSVGANMSVATAVRLAQGGQPPLAAMLLNYGAYDSSAHPSYRRYDGPAYNLTAEEMAGFWRGYVRDEADLADPLASPIRADLAGLPPAFLAVARCDILLDENLLLARRLQEAGVDAELRIYEGATHSFLEAVAISPLADRALAEGAAWLRGHLAASPAHETPTSGLFDPLSPAAVAELIDEYPLAWLVSGDGEDFAATPLPMLAELDDRGAVVALFGHIALSNPQTARLRASPRALMLFQGPHGYMSPEPLTDRNWGPTWNYAVARFTVDVEFRPDETEKALVLLLKKMEAGRPNPWSVAELGGRYHDLRRRIIAFRAHVRKADVRFKLGQDERPETLKELIDGTKDPVLAEWMRRANHSRLKS